MKMLSEWEQSKLIWRLISKVKGITSSITTSNTTLSNLENNKSNKIATVDASTLPASLDPNKVYQLGTLSGNVTIPSFTSTTAGDTEAKVWHITFTTSSTPPVITWPNSIQWIDDPVIEGNMYYEVNIYNNVGLIIGVEL